MKNLTIILSIFPLIIYSQEYENFSFNKNQFSDNKHTISTNSDFSIESDDLNNNFINTMLYGGFITNEMKSDWINTGDDINRLNAHFINNLRYNILTKNGNLFIEISDINILNSTFSDDLLRLSLEGNSNYQNQTLDFSNTIIRANRYQQYKIGYHNNLRYQGHQFNINAATSYLNGNHHLSYIINQGSLYTSEFGSSLDIDYDIQSFITDTTNRSLFSGNGSGFSIDFGLSYLKDNNIFSLSIYDLGFISWNQESTIFRSDSNFSFSGIEIEDFTNIVEYGDSINNINADDIINSYNNKFRSFVPCRINLKYIKELNKRYIQSIKFQLNYRWQPYEVKGPISFSLLKQGIKESGYTPNINLSSKINIKKLVIEPGIHSGGFTDNIKFHLSLSNKKRNITLGTSNLESLLKKDRTSFTAYIGIIKRF